MAIPFYLAMTAAEFQNCRAFPRHTAWMACHFSSYGTALSNLPTSLPENAMLIVNDRTPIHGHDPQAIAAQLNILTDRLRPRGILLDFQRLGCEETKLLVQTLVGTSKYPLGVSEGYAGGLSCPVFLPPVKLNSRLADHLAPWKGREVWLDAAPDTVCFTVTETGCKTQPQPYSAESDFPLRDEGLHCHYRIEENGDSVRFWLHRTREDLTALLAEAETLGVTLAVGLYQELGK